MEGFIGKDVLTDWDRELSAVLRQVRRSDCASVHGPKIAVPARAGHDESTVRCNLVTAVEQDDAGIARSEVDHVLEPDHRSAIDHIVGVEHHAGCSAIGEVAISPNACSRAAGRVGDVTFVAIFPMVPIDDRVISGRGKGDLVCYLTGRSSGGIDRKQCRGDVRFFQRHIQRKNRRWPGRSCLGIDQ